MSRFQAITDPVVDAELEMLRTRLGLETSQKAELLRELATLAAWIVRQSEEGREVEARTGAHVEPLRHPVLERLRRQSRGGVPIELDDEEVRGLARVLDREFTPSPALRRTLTRLARPRRAPRLRWKKRAG